MPFLPRALPGYVAIVCAVLGASPVVADTDLTPVALFHRCYGQITQTAPDPAGTLALQVASGQLSPIDACLQTLDQAALVAQGGTALSLPSDPVAVAVLNTFHNLHASWFTNQDFLAPGGATEFSGMQDLWDTSAPALYFTQALFKPNSQLNDVLTGTVNLVAVRTSKDPTKGQDPTVGARTKAAKATYIFGEATRFAPVGTLIGVAPTDAQVAPYPYLQDGKTYTGSVAFGQHFGGGILGSTPFLLLNVGEISSFKADGGVGMPRKWARAVFSDLLCRDLPLVRLADVPPAFVAAASVVPFRQAAPCVQCHVTMDRAAAVLRNFRYNELGPNDPAMAGADFPSLITPSQPAEAAWPTAPDGLYFQRPPHGVLYYRTYAGDLVNEPVTGLADLGQALAQRDDFALCVAKRYYRYFTGADVQLDDPDPAIPQPQLSPADAAHRGDVVALGLALASDQSVRKLVERILRLKTYASASFGANP